MNEFLDKYFHYYRELPDDKKPLFMERTREFAGQKQFIPRQGAEITAEVKTIISAVAVQVSFGLSKFLLPHFKTIIVYPDSYFSIITKRYHRGEVNMSGAVVLSWRDLLVGLKDPYDNFNVGIHEFAHAVFFENFIKNEEYLFIDKSHFDKWKGQAKDIIRKMRRNLPVLFRDYAATNEKEFFAVTSEYFFETPKTFKKEAPELFETMCKIYNQRPV